MKKQVQTSKTGQTTERAGRRAYNWATRSKLKQHVTRNGRHYNGPEKVGQTAMPSFLSSNRLGMGCRWGTSAFRIPSCRRVQSDIVMKSKGTILFISLLIRTLTSTLLKEKYDSSKMRRVTYYKATTFNIEEIIISVS